MESRPPQNPEFRNNPENFHACLYHIRDLIGFFILEEKKINKIFTIHEFISMLGLKVPKIY